MNSLEFRAGGAALPLSPPLGLPMIGFVRQRLPAQGYGRFPLETSALVLERNGRRVVLCGVDIAMIRSPEVDKLVDRVAEAVGAEPAGVLLNWNHTHLAPPGGMTNLHLIPDLWSDTLENVEAFARVLQDTVVSVCVLAAEKLERARVVWGVGEVDLAVNRRERTADGRTILGWNPRGLVDNQVVALQARRLDETPIATLVSFGCHPVTTGMDFFDYSADYPGPMRTMIRQFTGGECVFFQGAGGNVLPRVAFTVDEQEAERVGRRLAIEALRSLSDRFATPPRVVAYREGSVSPITTYRLEQAPAQEPALDAAREVVRFPLQPLPDLEEIGRMRSEFDAAVLAARSSGDVGKIKVALYPATWAQRTEEVIRTGRTPTFVEGPVHAVRIGDGVIITGAGETFTEIGIAVKERAPGRPTAYCGYTNGAITYFATAAEYPFGGYEPGFGNRSYDLPAQVTSDSERILVEGGVRLAERLFPDAEPWPADAGWLASGSLPGLAAQPLEHPSPDVAAGYRADSSGAGVPQ